MKAALIRWLRIMPLAFALVALGGCSWLTGPKSPELAAREVVRGAVAGASWGVRVATAYCAHVVARLDDSDDSRADALWQTCADSFDAAKAALVAADVVVDAWDAAAAGKVACLAGRALVAFDAILAALEKVGAKLPADVRATVDDGVKLGRFLVALVPGGGSCPMPAKKPEPAFTPSSGGGSVSRGALLGAGAVFS